MSYKMMLLACATAAAATSAVPASAVPYLFELTGGKTASFTINTDTPTDFFSTSVFGDQISYNDVPGVFGGLAGTASIGFGTSIFAQLNIGGTALGFTQYGGPDLFSLVGSKPVFNVGSFALTSITSGPATLQISAAAVPEAATWAMMIAGFGCVGMAMRRSTRKVITGVQFA